MRLININTVRQMLNDNKPYEISEDDKTYVMGILLSVPEVDAVPVVRGNWNRAYKSGYAPPDGNPVCSACDCWGYAATKWCPHCGAKMEADNESNS